MYASTNTQMCHLDIVRVKTFKVSLPGATLLSSFFRALASSISLSVKKKVFGDSGRPGKTKKPINAMGTVMMPSIMKSHLLKRSASVVCPDQGQTYLQPARPWTPFRFV